MLWLDDQEPPLKTVSRALAKQKLLMQPVATLHWVSHGTPGRLHIGATQINSNSYSATGLDLSSPTDGTLTITGDVTDIAGDAATQAIDSTSKDTTSATISVAINDGSDGRLNAAEDGSVTISGTTATVNSYSVSNRDLSSLGDGTLTITAVSAT